MGLHLSRTQLHQQLRILIYITAVLLSSTVAAQKRHSIGIAHKHEKYYLTKTCYDILEWEEVALTNKKIQNKVNSIIRKAVRSYKEDYSLRCDKELNYSVLRTFKVVYANNGIISYHLESNIYYKGILHDFHSFNSLNFNAETGQQITLDSLIEPAQLSNLYNLVIANIALENKIDGLDSNDVEAQFEHQNFLVTNEGIKMLYLIRSYPMEVTLTFQELRSYVNKNSRLGRLTDMRTGNKR